MRLRRVRHAFLYIAVVSIAIASSNIAWAQTPITGCTKITEPGSYVLKNNITVPVTTLGLNPTWLTDSTTETLHWGCIVIAADFVTVDLAGYLITGDARDLHGEVGIAQDTTGRIGDVVQSGSITGFEYGVAFVGIAHTIKEVNVSRNSMYGIYLNGTGNRVIGNIADGISYPTHRGIAIVNCPNVLLGNMSTDLIITGPGCTRQGNSPAP